MASAANNQAINAAVRIFNAATDEGKCSKFLVSCRTGSAVAVLVRVPGLHATAEWMAVTAGNAVEFEIGPRGIAAVYAQGDGGIATVDYCVTSRAVSYG